MEKLGEFVAVWVRNPTHCYHLEWSEQQQKRDRFQAMQTFDFMLVQANELWNISFHRKAAQKSDQKPAFRRFDFFGFFFDTGVRAEKRSQPWWFEVVV